MNGSEQEREAEFDDDPETEATVQQTGAPELGESVSPGSPQAITRGRELGGYRLEALIGAGAMGRVYRACHLATQRPAAVKLLAHQLSQHPSTLVRFRREARTVAQLNHPAIVRVDEVFEANGHWCIAMELVAAGTLRERLKRGIRWSEAEALDIVEQTAEGLWAAAKSGVVHRDIKPANLLLTEDGKVKIADFGIAKAKEDTVSLTATGSLIGTGAYMAPEQWEDGRSADHRSDLYALGCTLYELLVGQTPFPGPTLANYAKQHTLNPVPDIRTLRPELSTRVCDVIETLLQKDRALRPQSGADLVRLLRLEVAEAPGTDAEQTPTAKGPDQAPQVDKAAPAADSPVSAASGGVGWRRKALAGCALVVLVGIVALVEYSKKASARLDRRCGELATDIFEYQARTTWKKLGMFGGNAADDYAALTWVVDAPEDWERDPPWYVQATTLPMNYVTTKGADLQLLQHARLEAEKGGELPHEALTLKRELWSMVGHLRDGLQRESCVWGGDLRFSGNTRIPNLLAHRAAVDLLALEAYERPAQAVECGLQILAFGLDHLHHPALRVTFSGLDFIRIACEVLRQAIESHHSVGSCFWIISRLRSADNALDALPFDTERLASLAWLAAAAGRPLHPRALPLQPPLPSVYAQDLLLDREWSRIEQFYTDAQAIFVLPSPERLAQAKRLTEEFTEGWGLSGFPDLERLARLCDTARIDARSVQVLAAARLEHTRSGVWPSSIAVLHPDLIELPQDPYAPGALRYGLDAEGRPRVYSVSFNGVDDGGQIEGAEPDRGMRLEP